MKSPRPCFSNEVKVPIVASGDPVLNLVRPTPISEPKTLGGTPNPACQLRPLPNPTRRERVQTSSVLIARMQRAKDNSLKNSASLRRRSTRCDPLMPSSNNYRRSSRSARKLTQFPRARRQSNSKSPPTVKIPIPMTSSNPTSPNPTRFSGVNSPTFDPSSLTASMSLASPLVRVVSSPLVL
jgi:hypothetical protein